MAPEKRQALGKGLAALLGPQVSIGKAAPKTTQDEPNQKSVSEVAIGTIQPNRFQPRQDFDDDALTELSRSIRETGLIQPLVVRPRGDGYELIAGERRLRAAQRAGLNEVPVVLRDVTDEESLLIALVENVQREDLNAIDESEAYARLRDEFSLSQEQVAQAVGKSRSAVANALRLLTLPAEMREDVRDGVLTAGHARALLAVTDAPARRTLWEEIKRGDLSVREAEARSQDLSPRRGVQTSAFTGRPRGSQQVQVDALTEALTSHLGLKVKIARRVGNRGRVELHFGSVDEFERILDLLGLPASDRM